MKTLISAFVIFILLTSPVFADGRHKHDRDMKGEGMGVMSHEQMMAMHKHMREMRSIMEKIKKETDQKKRHELMQNHMDSMKKGMHMMMSKNISMKQGKGHDMSSMKMGDRMDMMEQRMNMMQMMMGQMMEHEVEKNSSMIISNTTRAWQHCCHALLELNAKNEVSYDRSRA